jgi:hypothetical protein
VCLLLSVVRAFYASTNFVVLVGGLLFVLAVYLVGLAWTAAQFDELLKGDLALLAQVQVAFLCVHAHALARSYIFGSFF